MPNALMVGTTQRETVFGGVLMSVDASSLRFSQKTPRLGLMPAKLFALRLDARREHTILKHIGAYTEHASNRQLLQPGTLVVHMPSKLIV
jgi:hypothetical protein